MCVCLAVRAEITTGIPLTYWVLYDRRDTVVKSNCGCVRILYAFRSIASDTR